MDGGESFLRLYRSSLGGMKGGGGRDAGGGIAVEPLIADDI
jgi:hypothetical protein